MSVRWMRYSLSGQCRVSRVLSEPDLEISPQIEESSQKGRIFSRSKSAESQWTKGQEVAACRSAAMAVRAFIVFCYGAWVDRSIGAAYTNGPFHRTGRWG